jgi:hypothetical protein
VSEDLVKRAKDTAAHNRAMCMPEDVDPADDLLDELVAEIERLRKQLFDSQQAVLREGMEVNRWRVEAERLVQLLHAEVRMDNTSYRAVLGI